MGHYNSKQTVPKSTFSPEIEILNKNVPSKFGEVKHVKDLKTGQEMYVKRVVTHDPESHNTQLTYYYNRVNNPHPNLVNVIGYTTEEKQAFCAEKYVIQLYVDSLYNNMQTELEKYIKNETPMSEVDLQLIAENMITILTEFQKKEIAHGDISPANIFITEEAYKLCDPALSNSQENANGVVKYLLLGAKTLMAPEILKQIPSKDYELRTNKYKADVFSLGATLLALASLTDSEDLYDYEHGNLDRGLLNARITKAADIYSPTFINLLKDMLVVEESARPDFIQLRDRLNISEVLQSYSKTFPVNSYAKTPYVKIAANLSSGNNSPLKVTSHSVLVSGESPVKSVQKSY